MTGNLETGIDKALQDQLRKQLSKQAPYSYLEGHLLDEWLSDSKQVVFKIGQRLLRPDELNSRLYLILKGTIRLLAIGDETEGIYTLDKRGAGQLIGWAGLLRGEATEFVQSSTEVVALSLCSKKFIELILSQERFRNYFGNLENLHEAYEVVVAANEQSTLKPQGWKEQIKEQLNSAKITTLPQNDNTNDLPALPKDWNWHLSTPGVRDIDVGTIVEKDYGKIERKQGFNLPYRFIGINQGVTKANIADKKEKSFELGAEDQKT